MIRLSAPAQVRSVRRGGPVSRAVKSGDAVTVHYVERLATNDAVVRDSRARKEAEQGDNERAEVPLTFIVGRNSVIKGIEKSVVGMEVGEVKDEVLVPAIDAYGEHMADLTATIPKESCPDGMKVGITVNLSNGLQAVVTDEVCIDRRPLPTRARCPLALTFSRALHAPSSGPLGVYDRRQPSIGGCGDEIHHRGHPERSF